MKGMTIKRIAENEHGNFGVIIDNRTPFAVTLERRYIENKPFESAIPPGIYICIRTVTPKHGETFRVGGVPGRSDILFHTGNRDDDSEGCILIAEEFGQLGQDTAVLGSRRGFDEFMRRLEGEDKFMLYIINA